MTWEQFTASLADDRLPGSLSGCLQAMWYDAKGDWHKSHEVAQNIEDRNGSWVYAYLHRKEGDAGNATYWYRRAGKPVPSCSLKQEQEEIVRALL